MLQLLQLPLVLLAGCRLLQPPWLACLRLLCSENLVCSTALQRVTRWQPCSAPRRRPLSGRGGRWRLRAARLPHWAASPSSGSGETTSGRSSEGGAWGRAAGWGTAAQASQLSGPASACSRRACPAWLTIAHLLLLTRPPCRPPTCRGHIPGLARAWEGVRPGLAKTWPFELDVFQKEAIVHMESVSGRVGSARLLDKGMGGAWRRPPGWAAGRPGGCVHTASPPRFPAPPRCPPAGPLRVCGRAHLCWQDGAPPNLGA